MLSFFLSFFLIGSFSILLGQSGIYDRPGLIPGHGSYTSVPAESVDLFTGNLTLRYLDIFLPGSNGLNLELWRVYNSKVLKDRQDGQGASVQAEHKSWVGVGWTMHMGRVYDYDTNTPVIEFPDGRRETFYADNYGTGKHISREFLKYDKQAKKLYFKNGVVWTFGATARVYFGDGTSKLALLTTNIRDPYDHYITITYKLYNGSFLPVMSVIQDSLGRQVTFVSSTGSYPKLQQVIVKNWQGQDVEYNYSVGTFSSGYYKLQSFIPPGIPATNYEYNNGQDSQYELTRVTTGYGGVMEFVHENHDFYFNTTHLVSRVVAQKRITFNQGEQAKTWSFAYPTYNGAAQGTTTVQGPEFSAAFTHHAYDSAAPWKIGLIKEWGYGDGSSSETYAWTYQEISNQTWSVLGVNMGTAKGPLLSSVQEDAVGDASLKTEYLYERTDTKKYGLPTRVKYYVNGSAEPKSYSDLTYFYESSTGFRDRYMLAFVSDETQRSGSGDLMKRTATSYFQEAGKWGAVDWVRKYKTESEYYTWDYDYTSSAPSSVKITIDPPGSIASREIYYSYGVENQVIWSDGQQKKLRQISQYDSSVISEENQHGGVLSYEYDDAGRITKISRPAPFDSTVLTWRPNGENKVVITQGDNIITKYWDGLGRETGYTESGGGTTLYYLKTLDAEGRLKEENAGGIDPGHKYVYILDNSGRVESITDPMQRTTVIAYSGRRKTITDPNQNATAYDYEDLPGLATRVTDALGKQAVHAYDALGRLRTVVFNGARTQSYEYELLGNLLSESHPETGTISYAYNAENLLLTSKTWGSAEHDYEYDEGNGRLKKLTAKTNGNVDEVINYGYDEKGRLSGTSGSGWTRSNITYNIWGAVTKEIISISGLPAKTIQYGYDGGNNQSQITYPSGRQAQTAYNGLNMPGSIIFNGSTIVDSASYGANKMPVRISIAGNGTVLTASYSNSGLLTAAALTKGGATLYDAAYTYDGAGNITNMTSTAPSPALSATFAYDPLNRLVSAAYSTGRVSSYSYEYDAYGNLLAVRENGAPVFEKTYDTQNRVNGFSYDDRGNLLAAAGKLYAWDSLNRLRTVQNTSGEMLGKYVYDDRGLRLKALPPLPEITVKQGDTDIPDGGTVTFKIVSQEDRTFTIRNDGDANLTLGQVVVSGQDALSFQVIQQPDSPLTPLASTTFVIRFQPQSGGLKMASLSLSNNDLDENPFDITLLGNYEPEIDIIGFPDGASYDFGTLTIGDFAWMSFTIQNLGTAPLHLTGSPLVEISGPDRSCFTVEQEPSAVVQPGQTTSFTVQFAPMSEGPKTAYLTIASDDLNENPYHITLYGAGAQGPAKIIKSKNQLEVTYPEGGERLLAGSLQTIYWSGGEEVRLVNIEYSNDNGSTYRLIAAGVPNTGSYDWLVPKDVSSSCLVRITDAEVNSLKKVDLVSFEFTLRIPGPQELFAGVPGLTCSLTMPDIRLEESDALILEFVPDESRGRMYVSVNKAWAAPKDFDVFLDRWHRVRVVFDRVSRLASVWMDDEPLLGSVPLEAAPQAVSYGSISFSSESRARSRLRVEDVEVKVTDPAYEPEEKGEAAAPEVFWKRLFLEDFEGHEAGVAVAGQGGWVSVLCSSLEGRETAAAVPLNPIAELLRAGWASRNREQGRPQKVDFKVDEGEAVSGLKSLIMDKAGDGKCEVTKVFALPLRGPFDVSGKSFEVVERATGVRESREARRIKRGEEEGPGYGPERARQAASGQGSSSAANPSVPSTGTSGSGRVQAASVSPAGTYYIYAIDGRLLAEYNGVGFCVREYIYMGGKLVAEYRPADNRYYYYTTDQIGSTRIVTDDNGTVVYAAAHDPYGGIQQTWESGYDPALKFSGKERDTESGLDYFGARYYDHTLYRFISIDPLIAKGASLMALQSWNGYSYCQNNPIGRIEIQGLFSLKITVENVYRVRSGDMTPVGAFPCNKLGLTLLTGGQITPYPGSNGKMALAFELKFDVYILEDSQLESLGKDAKSVWVHEISCHVHFVSQWITLSLGRIEKKWQKEMMEDPDKALQNAYKRLEAASRTAERLSRILFDDELSGILERLYRYMEEINSYWIPWRSDPLMAWVLNVPYCI